MYCADLKLENPGAMHAAKIEETRRDNRVTKLLNDLNRKMEEYIEHLKSGVENHEPLRLELDLEARGLGLTDMRFLLEKLNESHDKMQSFDLSKDSS